MLTLKNIEDFITKTGVEIDTTNSSKDEYGNIITVIDPEANFKTIRSAILKNPVLNKKVNTQGVNFIEIFDTVWIDGNRVNVAILILPLVGTGVRLKMMVKSIDASINGEVKKFLSFESYLDYKAMFQN